MNRYLASDILLNLRRAWEAELMGGFSSLPPLDLSMHISG
jgi:hypothetical protein